MDVLEQGISTSLPGDQLKAKYGHFAISLDKLMANI